MSENILDLFIGLTPQQVRTLRERIIPTLQSLRSEILKECGPVQHQAQARAPKQAESNQRLEHGAMPIENSRR